LLFAANAGSGTVSVFRVEALISRCRITSHGRKRTQRGGTARQPRVRAEYGRQQQRRGFALHEGKLTRIPDSLHFLSGNGAASASLAFSPDGRFLLVTERTTNRIDVFGVLSNGTLASITVNASVRGRSICGRLRPNGTALVSETGPGGPNSSAISSYAVQPNGTLTSLSGSIPTLGAANCWNAITPDGRFVYTSNAGSSSISGFAIGNTGALTPLPGTVVGINPAGSTNIDIAASADGKFLYSLNAGSGSVGSSRFSRRTAR